MIILSFVGLSIYSIFQILVNQGIQGGLSLKETVSHHFQRMDLMLIDISTFKRQWVKTSKRVENTRAHLHRFTFYILV